MQPKKILGAFGEIRPELCHRNDLNTWTGMLGAFLLSVLGRGISASVAQLFDENKKTACDFQCCDGLFQFCLLALQTVGICKNETVKMSPLLEKGGRMKFNCENNIFICNFNEMNLFQCVDGEVVEYTQEGEKFEL